MVKLMVTAQTIAEKIWNEGFQDIVALRRQRPLLETLADVADRVPDEVDYDGTVCVFGYKGQHQSDRGVEFRLSRFGGTAKLNLTGPGTDQGASWSAVSAKVRSAMAWVDEQKPKKARAKSAEGV
jgi:hypothetical protein